MATAPKRNTRTNNVKPDDITAILNTDRGKSLCFAATDLAGIGNNSLVELRKNIESKNRYEKMAEATKYCKEVPIPQRLALWRAGLWSRGFRITHPHKDIDKAYQQLTESLGLVNVVAEGMKHLSINNNAVLIWQTIGSRGSEKIEYVQFYQPYKTRLDILRDTLWCMPDDEFVQVIKGAKDEEIAKYKNKRGKGSSATKWIEAIKNANSANVPALYRGMVPMNSDDGGGWEIFAGGGGGNGKNYADVTMESIFPDIELLKFLYEGDWSAAYLMKNLIILVKVGESITTGPMAGSKKNWATTKDVENLQNALKKSGKAQALFGNHTIDISFVFPDPDIFSAEKYSAVIDRICWFFGIGTHIVLGSSKGGSYASNTWNIQSLRIESEQVRETFTTHFLKFLLSENIVKATFKGMGTIYTHNCVSKIEGQALHMGVSFADLSKGNFKDIEYSQDGFLTVEVMDVFQVLGDAGIIVLSTPIPQDARPEQFRISMKPAQALSLYGSPTIKFDRRSLKEDRQRLAELTAMITQGPLSNADYLDEMGYDLADQTTKKAMEWSLRRNLIPIFETSQGIISNIGYGLGDLLEVVISDAIDKYENSKKGQVGRPEGNGNQLNKDVNDTPSPSDG